MGRQQIQCETTLCVKLVMSKGGQSLSTWKWDNNAEANDSLHEENIPQLRAIVSWVKDNTTAGKSFIMHD